MRMRAAKSATALSKEMADANPSPPPVWTFFLQVKKNLRFESVSVWDEVNGSLGDLGTFLPLLLTLAFVNGVDLGTTLMFTGLYNIVTGIVFGIPMPVQPMKYIFVAAIADNNPMTVPQIMAAGLSTALVLLVCGVTGLMNIATRLVPTPVIRGFQLSQGILFGITAVQYIVYQQDLTTGKVVGQRKWWGTDGIVLALVALAFVMLVSGPGDDMVQESDDKIPTSGIGEEGSVHGGSLTQSLLQHNTLDTVPEEDEEVGNQNVSINVEMGRYVPPAIPSALIVFFIGLVLTLIRDPSVLTDVQLGPKVPQLVHISWEDWKIGFLRGAAGQIPLSLISTVVAVTKLSHSLFPGKKNVTGASVSSAVGLFNLVGCWFGTLPVECGAGGLAAQFRFRARDGWAVIMLGGAKLFVSLLLGSSLLRLLAEFPIGLLGVILLLAGSELAMFCRDQTSRLDAFVMIVCATAILSGLSAPLGFACGFATYLVLKLRQLYFSYDFRSLVESTPSSST
ncbi:unnamed protein product [Calypogeia fissa]